MPVSVKPHDPLANFKEGLVVKSRNHSPRPIPLASTAIDVAIDGLFATVKTTRVFRNDEDETIEATMTYPVPIDAVAHGLKVKIGDRLLTGVAQARKTARDTYENAVSQGKTVVIHEEALKGVHVLSVGHVGPGEEVAVEISWSKPLSRVGDAPSLRIPTTVASIYGRSPLMPVDDILTHDSLTFDAEANITVVSGIVHVAGAAWTQGKPVRLPLDRPIDITITGMEAKPLHGTASDGRKVKLSVEPLSPGERPIRFGIAFDRSGSTADPLDGNDARGVNVWTAAMRALKAALTRALKPGDVMHLWEFDNAVNYLGRADSPSSALTLAGKIGPPNGGTEIGKAIAIATDQAEIDDIVVVTDGRTYALPAHELAARGKRISAVLCGTNSLDAIIGHLVAMTGGQIVVASSANIEAAMESVLAALRFPATPASAGNADTLPDELFERRAGMEIAAAWGGKAKAKAIVDPVGAYAAALAIPMLTQDAATRIAVEHGLCTHLTSLVVVDEAGTKKDGLPSMRKVPLGRPMEEDMSFLRSAAPMTLMASSFDNDELVACSRSFESSSAYKKTIASSPSSTSAFRSMSIGKPLMRGSNSPKQGHVLDEPEFPPLPPRNFAAAPSASTSSVRTLAAMIDWDGDANRLSHGEIAHLSPMVRSYVELMASRPDVTALATAIGKSPLLTVLALLAREAASGGRGAVRFARAVLGSADAVMLGKAVAALGLAA